MPWIETFSGCKFEYTLPVPCLQDVIHALCNLCRFTGHCCEFYSVAEHCLNCDEVASSLGYTVKERLAVLLHDAPEAYLGDVNSPLKSMLPDYQQLEEQVTQACWVHLWGEVPSPELLRRIKQIDLHMLREEARALMQSKGKSWDPAMWEPLMTAPEMPRPRIYCWAPSQALTAMYFRFDSLTRRMRCPH